MQTSETFARAREAARVIADRGVPNSGPHVIGIGGPVGGRETNPVVFHGHAVRYVNGQDATCIKFWPDGDIRDALRSGYVVDGVPMYVAGWEGAGNGSHEHKPDGYVLLHPYVPEYMPNHGPRRMYFFLTDSLPALNGEAY
jgi:hypothetical protein